MADKVSWFLKRVFEVGYGPAPRVRYFIDLATWISIFLRPPQQGNFQIHMKILVNFRLTLLMSSFIEHTALLLMRRQPRLLTPSKVIPDPATFAFALLVEFVPLDILGNRSVIILSEPFELSFSCSTERNLVLDLGQVQGRHTQGTVLTRSGTSCSSELTVGSELSSSGESFPIPSSSNPCMLSLPALESSSPSPSPSNATSLSSSLHSSSSTPSIQKD